MTTILGIDTSSYRLGVSVCKDGQVIAEYSTWLKKNHALRLMPAVEHVLQDVDLKPADLDAIAVAKGPGSYTGVRMAVTTAKSLAWALKIPLIPLSTLAVMAEAGRYFNGMIVPLIDARRGTVFAACYQATEDGTISAKEAEKHQSLADLLEQLKTMNQRILFVGEDVSLHQEAIQAELGDQAMFTPGALPSARAGALCLLALRQEPVENVHAFTPDYHRLPEAEVNWQHEQQRNETERSSKENGVRRY
ncbi:tRNA (adenosine(37)-N6)-threonylcarbamoyltransferase complex dimerization subunit type 1 TsaB [Shouchella sp. JSM 1781072]|uniref:tRNA (adenosine(37)-N6)-threonylcarbamoyltransferase complex dimerization subunit type 1 TsaB n=1 Tax=Bacillaceae TaxID=186817 RepID=UPI000C07B499|nr:MULTISPECIES: tRNA (adenosine(37)-N6)-threonylcarbamoyltransferase complex dimerization subunit type 1 TsaB [Bacillaceae]UTR05706.1 tRNA (adenosine(37)-N6)-threonylcarbamoyltransferase complex dimerization subunit type 1 TsaB [Alkalihalobacillus sp. LMS6]